MIWRRTPEKIKGLLHPVFQSVLLRPARLRGQRGPAACSGPGRPDARVCVAPPSTIGQVQPVGVSTNVVTRYGLPRQLNKPLDLVQRMGAGYIVEQLRWDKVEPPCGQWDWLFYDELAQEAAKRNRITDAHAFRERISPA